jgi:Na+-driven multidrug efflux pump
MEIARAMVICHWFFGIPLATLLAFTMLDMGLLGLWLGRLSLYQ